MGNTGIMVFIVRYLKFGFSRLYYRETADTWKDISIGEDNDDFLYAKRYYYSETEPTAEGNYWYYDLNGEVQTW